MNERWVRLPLVVLATLIVHDAVLRGLRLDGVRPDFLLGLAVVAGLVGGPERGAVFGFVAGLVADLFLPTPLGLSALIFCLMGYTVGTLQTTFLPQGRASIPLTTLVASAAAEVLFALVGSVVGLRGMLTVHLVTIALIVALVNSLVSPLLARAVRWSLVSAQPRGSFAP
ncbi:MAG TPA: rod shape-determining protein MreD [Acidimicrobiales bacterium]|nr:rod shape-determining protein MreD [Acidimicrobiales bacterium]